MQPFKSDLKRGTRSGTACTLVKAPCKHSTLRICESIGSESTRTVDVDFTADDSNDDVEPGDEDGGDGE